MSKEPLKRLKTIYNGAVFQFTAPASSSKPIRKICNTTSLPKGLTSEKVIREIRKG